MSSYELNKKKHILIIGGGACGMSAAYAFCQHPERFSVSLYERSGFTGGMATSAPLEKEKYGADYINDGVQGASPVFYNTYAMFERLGFKASDVSMQVSFGRDEETEFWSNVFPSRVIDKFRTDIKKFGKVLKVIKTFEPMFALISVSAMLRMFRFSKEFGDTIVFPLVALFFGTGNQTPFISSAILERVFMDPNMRLFEYSPDTFLASVPTMKAFPRLSLLYETWTEHIHAQSRGAVQITTCREVLRVVRKKNGIEAWSRAIQGTNNGQEVVEKEGRGGEEQKEMFDEVVFCCDADSALRILGKDATWMERKVLGNVKYLWDITVTHSDFSYMEKYYRMKYDPTLNSQESTEDEGRKKQFDFASKNFKPLYFIRSHPEDKSKLEMSFDLSVYQPQFDGISPYGPDAISSIESGSGPELDGTLHTSMHSIGDNAAIGEVIQSKENANSSSKSTSNDSKNNEIPIENHVFQTIFLNKEPESSKYWSKDEIDPSKIIMEKWWKQQSHRWQHYAGTVPWMGLINGKRHTYFAGAWTVLNMHEMAVVSGLGAAYQLGADYPFSDNHDCKRLFSLCLAANHMVRLRKEDREGFFA